MSADQNPLRDFVVVVSGPTGSGKSELAAGLARAIRGEIVNYDSVQIYRGFDIGSAKPEEVMRRSVPHHLFDIVEASDDFNASDYGRLSREVCASILQRDARPILVGGTGFYLRAFLSGLPELPPHDEEVRVRIRRISKMPRGPARLHGWLSRIDPEAAARIAPADRHRLERALEVWLTTGKPLSAWTAPSPKHSPETPSVKIALRMPRGELVARLDERVEAMYAAGLIEETRELLLRYPPACRPFTTIGYLEAVAVVLGTMHAREAIEATKRRTRAYSKRQMTWLRGERDVTWLDVSNGYDKNLDAAVALIEQQKHR